MNIERTTCAYFSMEIALDAAIPTYCGGLGVLAGDTIRSAADLRLPIVGVTLAHREGYFRQIVNERGEQVEESDPWNIDEKLSLASEKISVTISGRTVYIQAWLFYVQGIQEESVPVLLLDTDIPENDAYDRTLTRHLYGGDQHYRLCQELVLGVGGVRMLRALGFKNLSRFHMNEGHSSLLVLELLQEQLQKHGRSELSEEDIDAVRKQCIFTTHTPIPAGHDKFSLDTVREVFGDHPLFEHNSLVFRENVLNMTFLGFNFSHYINGVAKLHGKVSRELFTNYTIDSITNGVHAAFWASKPITELFDKYIPGWKSDNASLRYALNLPKNEMWNAHLEAKKELLQLVQAENGVQLSSDILTIGFARRMTEYKRPEMLFSHPDRLRAIARKFGGLQILYAGKAHPHDQRGKELIRQIISQGKALAPDVQFVFLPNYDMNLAKYLVSGVDLWLNTPRPPLEASGTSGMKAAVNGVPSLSVLDGWWIEGCIEGRTGWAIGKKYPMQDEPEEDATELYLSLEYEIAPLFYNDREGYIDVMQHTIALNGSFFTSERMLEAYVTKAYF